MKITALEKQYKSLMATQEYLKSLSSNPKLNQEIVLNELYLQDIRKIKMGQ